MLQFMFLYILQYYLPLLSIFRNPAMRQLHWDNISAITKFDVTPTAGTTFKKIINMNLMEDLEKYLIYK